MIGFGSGSRGCGVTTSVSPCHSPLNAPQCELWVPPRELSTTSSATSVILFRHLASMGGEIYAGKAPMSWETSRRRATMRAILRLEPVAGAENPPDDAKADDQERQRHAEADADMHVGYAEEAPAEAADEIHDRVEQRDSLPDRRQHVDRVERAAKERQRREDQQRDELQLLEPLRPDADNEAEQAEGHGRQDQEGDHPERMRDLQRHEEEGGRQIDQSEDDRFGRRRADIAEHDLEHGNRGG